MRKSKPLNKLRNVKPILNRQGIAIVFSREMKQAFVVTKKRIRKMNPAIHTTNEFEYFEDVIPHSKDGIDVVEVYGISFTFIDGKFWDVNATVIKTR